MSDLEGTTRVQTPEGLKDTTGLGRKVTTYEGLETFAKPAYCSCVTLTSDEMTAQCPVTEQPDWYIVSVTYEPVSKCIESKSFKLFVQSFKNKGQFCESLADVILQEVVNAVEPIGCTVTLTQKSRGGVSIESISTYRREEK